MRAQLYSPLLGEREVPGPPAKQGSPSRAMWPRDMGVPGGRPSAVAVCIVWGFLIYCPDGGLD